MADLSLGQYFKFDEADLQANRTGQFTAKQLARLAANDKSNRTWSLIGGVVLVLIAVTGLGSAVAAIAGSTDNGFRIAFGLGFGVLWPLIWGGIGYGLLSSSLTKHKFKLARVQGHAKIIRMETHNSDSHTTSVHYELHVGGQRFTVARILADVILQDDDHEYVLYYIDRAEKGASSVEFVKDIDAIQSAEELSVRGGDQAARRVAAKDRGRLVILDSGLKKIETIKVIRQLTGLGLLEAKIIAETPHGVVLTDVDNTTAGEAISLFEKAGASVRIE